MKYQRHWRICTASMMIPSLDASLRAVDNDLRHSKPDQNLICSVGYIAYAELILPSPSPSYLIALVGQLYGDLASRLPGFARRRRGVAPTIT